MQEDAKSARPMWKVDDKLYIEKGVDRWCSSQSCAAGNAAGVQAPQQAAPQAPNQAAPASTGDKFAQTSATHDKLWDMAGRKIEPVDFSTFVDDRERNKSRHILRQTFYYGLISIHTGNSPKR